MICCFSRVSGRKKIGLQRQTNREERKRTKMPMMFSCSVGNSPCTEFLFFKYKTLAALTELSSRDDLGYRAVQGSLGQGPRRCSVRRLCAPFRARRPRRLVRRARKRIQSHGVSTPSPFRSPYPFCFVIRLRFDEEMTVVQGDPLPLIKFDSSSLTFECIEPHNLCKVC